MRFVKQAGVLGIMRGGVIAAAVAAGGADAWATDDNPNNDAVLRIAECGTVGEDWYFAHGGSAFGDTINDRLARAAVAVCAQIGYDDGGIALGVFSGGIDYQDPPPVGVSSAAWLVQGEAHLVSVSFACFESLPGPAAAVVPSDPSCYPHTVEYPGGTLGLPGNPLDTFNLGNTFALAMRPQADPVVTIGEILGATAVSMFVLGNRHDGPGGLKPLTLALEKFEGAIRSDRGNARWRKYAASTIIRIAQRSRGGLSGDAAAPARKHLLVAEQLETGVAAYNLGCLAALVGNGQEARSWLELAARRHRLPSADRVASDPDLASVRAQPWFAAIVEAAGRLGQRSARQP